MEKKKENQCMVSEEDSFVASVSLYENLKKWVDAEFERLISRGRDIDKFDALTDPDSNMLTIVSDEYTMKFIKDERAIDLVVNGEKNSSIWDDVINNVPVQFASCIDNPMYFTYKLSTNTSEEKEFYYFESTDDESGELLPISIDELSPLAAWRAENFDELIESI